MKEKTAVLTAEQIEFACKQFITYLKICNENNTSASESSVEDSSLLRRLLLGKKAHDNPPPLRFKYPAWELVEDDEIEIHHFTEDEKGIAIDQHGGYSWADKDKKILEYKRLGLVFELIEKEVAPEAECVAEGVNPNEHKYFAKFLKRLVVYK